MATSNRAALFAKIHKVLRKHYESALPPSRPLFEHLLYGCLLENSPYEAADEVFARLQQSYFDWNEMRVTTVLELAEMFASLVQQSAAAAHFKRALQSVFEAHFAFDLEPLKKQNLGKAVQMLEKYSPDSRFAVAYATQHGLGGHSIPLGKRELNVLLVLGAITEAELPKGEAPGLERAIPKNKGAEFASLLHQFAVDFHAHPTGSKVKGILAEIDPASKDRLKQYLAAIQAAEVAREARREARREAARAERHTARTQAAEAAKEAKAPAKGPAPAKKGATDKPAQKPAEKSPPPKLAAPPKPAAPGKPAKPTAPDAALKKKPAEKPADKNRPPASKAPAAKPLAAKGAVGKPVAKAPAAKALARRKPR